MGVQAEESEAGAIRGEKRHQHSRRRPSTYFPHKVSCLAFPRQALSSPHGGLPQLYSESCGYLPCNPQPCILLIRCPGEYSFQEDVS